MKAVLAIVLAIVAFHSTKGSSSMLTERGLTAVEGLKVGHHTLTERPTGCTVVIAEDGAVAGVDVRGPAPGTRETALLDPTTLVDRVHAIVLSGGSAFGLDTATGVMRYLEEHGVGFQFGGRAIPIVPAAILFDLRVGDMKIRPDAACGYAAARSATTGPVQEGNVGAGAGATVGKLRGFERGMKGGVGTFSMSLPDGLVVAALAAVNPAGDVVDPDTGKVIAGVRTNDGRGLADIRTLLRREANTERPQPLQNTTLGVVATNATLTKPEATRMARMAQNGLARAIVPAHTSVDGDTVFALATGRRLPGDDVDRIGALASEAMAQAIVRAVRAATGIPGYPAARDLR